MVKLRSKSLETPGFGRAYLVFALLILLATSLFWALKSAAVQAGNADQLIGPLLFQNSESLNAAVFPGAHSFLLKWPLFWLVKLFGLNFGGLAVVTLLVVFMTLGGLVYVLYKIDRRPLVLGTLCLGLASALLLVPAQPYAGALLPVNLAMLATRNLEYIVYIACLVAFARWPSVRNWRFWAATGLLGLLVASDKLFLAISTGGAVLALIIYALARAAKLTAIAVHWLIASLVSGIVSIALLAAIQASNITNIGSQASPYATAESIHGLALGVIYSLAGLLTNFGANPGFDAIELKQLASRTVDRLFGLGGPAYLINAALLIGGLFMAYRLIWPGLIKKTDKFSRLDIPVALTVMLAWSTLAAVGVFVFSMHYYAVDARYLTIALFAVFIAAATYARKVRWPATRLVLIGGLLTVGMALSVFSANNDYRVSSSALASINKRNDSVGQAIKQHKTTYLVGDYWRVVPIGFKSKNPNTVPLQDCTTPQKILTRNPNGVDLKKHSFTYLLSRDISLTNYPRCNLDQVVSAYGRPNSSLLISGRVNDPGEQLLFYDRGAQKSSPKAASKIPATVLPIPLEETPYISCNGPTIMNVVAHEDDDLLFMNPDLANAIKEKRCVRTVYLTAGDAGHDQFYWIGREQGSQAAYSNMAGTSSIWVQRIVQLANNQFVTIANPRGNPNISIIYMQLPDGNLKGDGFSTYNHESLSQLDAGKIAAIHSVDKQSSYTNDQLVEALAKLMHAYQPATIRTQASYNAGPYADHSDHMAAGRLTQKAHSLYQQQQFAGLVNIPINYYVGYPIRSMPANVSGQELSEKQAAFNIYGKFDGGVCHSTQQCDQTPTYGSYLKRQYKLNSPGR